MFFEKETAEYKEIFKDEIDNFREAVDNALKKCVRFEYVSGGLELLEGYYSPNWALEHIVGGIKRGRLLKSKNPKAYTFKYGFDDDGKIIFRHSYYKENNTYLLYKYVDNVAYAIYGDCDDDGSYVMIRYFVKSVFDKENRILEYLEYYILDGDVSMLEGWLYDYQDDKVTVTMRHQFIEYLKRYKRYKMHSYDDPHEFILDENGNMLYYTSADGRKFPMNPKALYPGKPEEVSGKQL